MPALVHTTDTHLGDLTRIAEEIIEAVQGGLAEGELEGSVWGIHAQSVQKPLLRVVQTGNAGRLAELLGSLHTRIFTLGYDQHARITAKLRDDPQSRAQHARHMAHTLLYHAFALGVAPMWNAAQRNGLFTYVERDETDEIACACLDVLGLAGALPVSGPNTCGVPTARGVLNERQLLALGYLREVQAHLSATGRRYDRIVEIGGGLGRLAVLAQRVIDLPYTIIDLPAVAITQYALLRGNGLEARLFAPAPGARGVSLVNAFASFEPEDYRNSLFVNFDALVEMNRETQERYFDLIAASESDLLSGNHEAAKEITDEGHRQNIDIARIAERGLVAGPRQMFWERQGYVTQRFLSPREPLRGG